MGIRFAGYFLEMLDEEFKQNSTGLSDRPPVSFSLGMLLADAKSPVRRTVEFTEGALLKWAKQAFKESRVAQGNAAHLFANTVEQIPDDLSIYRSRCINVQGTI